MTYDLFGWTLNVTQLQPGVLVT